MQQGCNKGRNDRGTTQIQAYVTARSLQTSNKVLTDNAVLRSALMIHTENSGMSYTYKPSRCLTPTGSSLRRSVLYLVPVTVFKGLFNCTYYYICACGKCQGKFLLLRVTAVFSHLPLNTCPFNKRGNQAGDKTGCQQTCQYQENDEGSTVAFRVGFSGF